MSAQQELERKLDEIAVLAQRAAEEEVQVGPWRDLDPRDRSTWPLELLKHASKGYGFDLEEANNLQHYRENVIAQLIADRLGDVLPFLDAAIAYLRRDASFDTPEGQLLDDLCTWVAGLLPEVVAECLDLVPLIDEVMPFTTGESILAAVRERLPARWGEQRFLEEVDGSLEEDGGTGDVVASAAEAPEA